MTEPQSPSSTSGYSPWRLIAEELRVDITAGRLSPGDRLPSEAELTAQFGVSRHTVRRALASLAADGLVESHRGSGAFVTGEPVHIHRIGMRTRLSTNLGAHQSSTGRVLESGIEPAPAAVTHQLGLPEGAATLRVMSLRSIAGRAIALSTAWFDAAQFTGFDAQLRRTSSVTAALRSRGIDDYVRVSTAVSARHASAAESRLLELDAGAILLVTESLDAHLDRSPLQVVSTRFSAQRVHLDIEHAAHG